MNQRKSDQKSQFILLAGISGSGKSTYSAHLRDMYGFQFIETDKQIGYIEEAVRSNSGLVARYLDKYGLVAWEWGFLPQYLGCVLWLKEQGARLLWFKGDPVVARSAYSKAHPEDPTCTLWHLQMQRIIDACLPTPDFQIVETIRDGRFRRFGELDQETLQHASSH